ncbi:hypothetical protein ACLBWT_07290 [Paenibacillus sp. D51F]
MSISKTLVELMGGTIYAISQVGDGTLFIITMIAALPAGDRPSGSA